MSRAFVKELDAVPEPVPEFEISPGPNYVTAAGADAIARKIEDLEKELSSASQESRDRLLRDLRYWRLQEANAQIVAQSGGEEIGFGSRVVIERAGATQHIQLVGETEADPAAGRISWRSPLAQALIGARIGEIVELSIREASEEIKILAVE